jgi:hypothetical protein
MFPRGYICRKNPDRTLVAICPLCFMIAAMAKDTQGLHDLIRQHVCPINAFIASDFQRAS